MATITAFDETFDADLGIYNNTGGGGTIAWDSAGSPGAGSAKLTPVDSSNHAYAQAYIFPDSLTIPASTTLAFKYRVVDGDTVSGTGTLLEVTFIGPSVSTAYLVFDDVVTADTGWLSGSIDLTAVDVSGSPVDLTGTYLTGLEFRAYTSGSNPLDVYIDTVAMTSTAVDELRFLGLTADNTNVYATANDSGILKAYAINIETPALVELTTFGAKTYADIDAGSANLLPRAAADGVVWLYGLDGNGYQAQVSDNSGSSFTDKSAAGWAAGKVAVALEIDFFNQNDVVAVFSDDDVYQTTDGGTSWAQTGNAPGGDAVTAERHPFYTSYLMLASSAAGDVDVTPNLGNSWGSANISGGGTVTIIKKAL